jgi:hypothetical protein
MTRFIDDQREHQTTIPGSYRICSGYFFPTVKRSGRRSLRGVTLPADRAR